MASKAFRAVIVAAGLMVAASGGEAQQRVERECIVPAAALTQGLFVAARIGNAIEVPYREGCNYSFFGLQADVFYRSIRVVRQPAHGRVGTSGRAQFVYVPEAGFRGRDRFALELEGERGTRPGRTVVEFDVFVR